ncbi:MAG: phosphatase PAP2 family protein [Actinomycetota bacterium]|nr:phosphatase PAP2 family protein [Actinomycetota bacterium]
MGARSEVYRRRGPEGLRALAGLLDRAVPAAQRRLRSRWAKRAAAASVPVTVGLALARKRVGMHPALTLPVACAVPLGVAIALPRGRARYGAMLASYMWLFKVSWELPSDDREQLRRRLMIDYPIRFDSWIGAGVPPGLRLQRALREPGRVSALDKAVAVAYASWFAPHVLLGYLLARHHEYVPRAGARLAASYHLTTPFYWAVPTAPPWWASEEGGRMNGELERVLRHVVCDVLRRPVPERDAMPGNPWGSMPSDHIASAAITAMGLSEINAVYGLLGWGYVGAASFAVVYLGEHYVIDVIVGLACAELVRRSEPLFAPFVRAVARAVE